MSATPALRGADLRRSFALQDERRSVTALDGVSFTIESGSLTALVGPDGAGKTTLLRMAAGLLPPDAGRLEVLGLDVARDPQAVQDRISYMPQRFGLYEDLSVQENLDLYADLHGVPQGERAARYQRLMHMTQLGAFRSRLAGKLSGGMKQKLGLACTLVRSPELLLLDEPTVGVDPLSRRELWEIIHQLVDVDRLTVLLSTAYLDEAERCGRVLVLRAGRVLAEGAPAQLRGAADGHAFLVTPPPDRPARWLQSRLLAASDTVIDAVPQAGAVRCLLRDPAVQPSLLREVAAAPPEPVVATLEDAVMMLLHPQGGDAAAAAAGSAPPDAGAAAPAVAAAAGEPIIEVRNLTRRFGDFVAVADTSFSVRRGEVFGLLGPNGAGKTTTFRMLCGLLPASGGSLRVAGVNLRHARAVARARIGYVAQKFALYGTLSVLENLQFFAGAYGLGGARAQQRIAQLLAQFGLAELRQSPAGQLAGGYRQRLAMAAALLHQPQILFLDEPTSGADPLTRRDFWRDITALAEQGTTVVVTTHFMEEAEYCDRIVIQDAGRVLALGTPREVRTLAGAGQAAASMEQAFIGIVERARADAAQASRSAA
jgi:ABC-2 type transport system ATP-binding protein